MKTTTKSAFHRGFTLIELMIVIVILGVLMGTILPRLSGAQGRARDTARKADLANIAQALELYYSDFGDYPGTSGTVYCLGDPASGSTYANEADLSTYLVTYLKGGNIPSSPQADSIDIDTGGTECTGGYYLYIPLNARSVGEQGYLLATNVEIPTNANFITGQGSTTVSGDGFTVNSSLDVDDVLDDLDLAEPGDLITADDTSGATDGGSTVYVLVSGT